MSMLEFAVTSLNLRIEEDGLSNEGKTVLGFALALAADISGLEGAEETFQEVYWYCEVGPAWDRVSTLEVPDEIGKMRFRNFGSRRSCGIRIKIEPVRFERLTSAVVAGNDVKSLSVSLSTFEVQSNWETLLEEEYSVEVIDISVALGRSRTQYGKSAA